MSHLQDTLKAGGLVPTSAKLGKDDATDTVTARAYLHPVLPGRAVIRLTTDALAIGDDLEMTTLGFSAGDNRGAVAKERRRPLGFPGWALVNDPKNARYALDVVKEFKKQARKAKSKPGHAKDGIDTIAKKLGKSMPHFLPSFFEEAGRAFIEHGALSHAAIMFGKAREAEATHALDVDEHHRVDAFLEFALAGAVTTKALGQYAKDLVTHHKPDVAYAHFRQLCLQRTLGGMPPWSAMASDLRRLAKAANLDQATEDAAFIADIIESPALGKAAGEFWRAYQEPIVALGKRSASARGALLNLFPSGTSASTELDEAWLDLLDATGATDALTGNVEEVARPAGGRAAWFDKLTQHLTRGWRDEPTSTRAFALLRRMAPSLIADGTPIHCAGRWRQTDIDLVELALELGVPVAPAEDTSTDVNSWANRAGEPERGRDPVRVAAHPSFGPLLAESVSECIGDQTFDSASRGKQGFLDAKRAWLAGLIASAERGALPAYEKLLVTIEEKATAETFAEMPDLHERFAALDFAPALARTLQIGIIDELGWPALEEAAAELDPDDTGELTVWGGPPAVVLASKTRAIAVGATGRLGTHDLVIPSKHELAAIRFVDGEFLVVLNHNYKWVAYWSRAPRDKFELENAYGVSDLAGRAAVLPDGAWLERATPIRRGERTLTFGSELCACDGTTTWIAEHKDGRFCWREVTPTGEKGRISWPAFVEADLPPGYRIDAASYVLPAPSTSSLLGVANGLVGTRVRYLSNQRFRRGPTPVEIEMIDGTKWTGTCDANVSALVRFPGGGSPRLISDVERYEDDGANIYDPETLIVGSSIATDRRQRAGQVSVFPTTFWHHMVARDETGSRRLRAVNDADARALIAAVPLQAGAVATPPPTDVTANVLREITHPRLRRGVTGFAIMAVELRSSHQQLVKERAPSRASALAATRGPDDKTLREALGGWIPHSWDSTGSAWEQIHRVGAWFASDDRSDRQVSEESDSAIDWLGFAVAPWSLAFIATAIGTPAPLRAKIVELLAHVVGSLPTVNKLRMYLAERVGDVEWDDLTLQWARGNAYAFRQVGWGQTFHVLEYAPDGRFVMPDGFSPSGRPLTGTAAPTTDDIKALVSAASAGKTSWSPDAPARLAAATGLTPSDATFLWAGCPNSNNSSANFLPKELREQLGLKATQAATARDSIGTVPLLERLAVIDEAARDGVDALLDGRALDALANAWKRQFGARAAIPEELIAEAGRALTSSLEPSQALAMIGAAAHAPQLNVDGSWALNTDGELVRTGRAEPLVGQAALPSAEPAFDEHVLPTIAMYVPYLYAELPVGHALRTQAAAAHRLALSRLANPGLWLDGGSADAWENATKQTWQRVFDTLGGELLSGFEGEQQARKIRGAMLVNDDRSYSLLLHPATLDAKALATVENVVKQINYWGQLSAWQSLQYVRSPRLASIVARIEKTPVPQGGWEQNPRASVPKLVEKVAKQRKLSTDAAALYLQYLVLLWPTPKNLQEWNGWQPKQLQAANDELLEKELIMTAKRERAQRNHFLPGGWEPLKSPHPPMESWKLELYGTRDAQGTPVAPLGRFLALAPFHALFEAAWERVEGGNAPRYEEVVRKPGRGRS